MSNLYIRENDAWKQNARSPWAGVHFGLQAARARGSTGHCRTSRRAEILSPVCLFEFGRGVPPGPDLGHEPSGVVTRKGHVFDVCAMGDFSAGVGCIPGWPPTPGCC